MYSDLNEFRIKHGHSAVPRRWPKSPRLGVWIKRQRQRRKQGRMPKDRIAALDRLGFIWGRFDAAWDEMFQTIKEFKKRYEHCHVPARWAGHPRLARWVSV